MMRRNVFAGMAGATLMLLAAPIGQNSAEAYFVSPFPFFTPIADCGTVGLVPDLLNEGEYCTAWFPDKSPGAYLVGGLDDYDVGDEVFVEGLICNTCLTTCAAGAILNAQLSDCP